MRFQQLRGELGFTVWHLIEWNSEPFVHNNSWLTSREQRLSYYVILEWMCVKSLSLSFCLFVYVRWKAEVKEVTHSHCRFEVWFCFLTGCDYEKQFHQIKQEEFRTPHRFTKWFNPLRTNTHAHTHTHAHTGTFSTQRGHINNLWSETLSDGGFSRFHTISFIVLIMTNLTIFCFWSKICY